VLREAVEIPFEDQGIVLDDHQGPQVTDVMPTQYRRDGVGAGLFARWPIIGIPDFICPELAMATEEKAGNDEREYGCLDHAPFPTFAPGHL
jgi:hypothetical protein